MSHKDITDAIRILLKNTDRTTFATNYHQKNYRTVVVIIFVSIPLSIAKYLRFSLHICLFLSTFAAC